MLARTGVVGGACIGNDEGVGNAWGDDRGCCGADGDRGVDMRSGRRLAVEVVCGGRGGGCGALSLKVATALGSEKISLCKRGPVNANCGGAGKRGKPRQRLKRRAQQLDSVTNTLVLRHQGMRKINIPRRSAVHAHEERHTGSTSDPGQEQAPPPGQCPRTTSARRNGRTVM